MGKLILTDLAEERQKQILPYRSQTYSQLIDAVLQKTESLRCSQGGSRPRQGQEAIAE